MGRVNRGRRKRAERGESEGKGKERARGEGKEGTRGEGIQEEESEGRAWGEGEGRARGEGRGERGKCHADKDRETGHKWTSSLFAMMSYVFVRWLWGVVARLGFMASESSPGVAGAGLRGPGIRAARTSLSSLCCYWIVFVFGLYAVKSPHVNPRAAFPSSEGE